jgi:hypothetical protein
MAQHAYHSSAPTIPSARVDRRNAVMPMVARIATPNSPTPTPASSHLSSIVRRCMLTIYLPRPNWPRPCDATTVPTVDRNPRHDRRVWTAASFRLSTTYVSRQDAHTCTHMQHTCWQSSTDVQRAPTEHLRSHAGPGGVVVRQRTNDTATREMP